MPLYRASVTQFRVQMMDGSLVPTLTTQYRHHVAHNPAPAEVRSWERSLHALSADLIQAGLDDVEVLVEHQLPLTSKRADVVLYGVHPRTGDRRTSLWSSSSGARRPSWRTAWTCVWCPALLECACTPGSR